MNTNIFLVQTHPIFPNIFLTGDYEGQVILWDASEGVILKVFEEKLNRSEFFPIPNPILEAQFFPNGLQFVISTYYGKISLYGYGAFHDVALQPDEQFFEKDLTREEFQDESNQWAMQNNKNHQGCCQYNYNYIFIIFQDETDELSMAN